MIHILWNALKNVARTKKKSQKRHDKFYEQKRVEVIYTVGKDVVITVTVYVFYGK